MRGFLIALACIPGLVQPPTGLAQEIPKSQLSTVSQEIAGGRIDVRYRRPVARGRQLFGELVPWGEVWTPSADSAAQVTLSAPVEINGQSLAAGSYALWTIIFSSRVPVFHLRYPRDLDVLRVSAVPQQGEHVETLQFDFPVVDADSAVMRIRWGSTTVPLKIRVLQGSGR